MSPETNATSAYRRTTSEQWVAGAAGGFVGSILFGLMMMYVMPAPLLEIVIPAMYGFQGPSLLTGWVIHQFHGVVLGIAYVALIQAEPFRETARNLTGALGLAVVYGIITTLLLAVLLMPLWLQAVGFPAAPPFPNVGFPATIVSMVGHIVYAIPVAVAYAVAAK